MGSDALKTGISFCQIPHTDGKEILVHGRTPGNRQEPRDPAIHRFRALGFTRRLVFAICGLPDGNNCPRAVRPGVERLRGIVTSTLRKAGYSAM
jgi:hypothetical protein